MERVFVFKKKIVISLLIICILILVSTAVPAINSSIKDNILSEKIKDNYPVNNERIITEYFKNDNEEINSINDHLLLLSLLNKIQDNYEIPLDFYKKIQNYFGFHKMAKNEIIDLFFKVIIPLDKECKEIISGNKEFQDMSLELSDLWLTFEDYFFTEDNINNNFKTNYNSDFNIFINNYVKATDIWLGISTPENRWPILNILSFLGVSYNNYYEWSTKITDHLNFTIVVSSVITAFCIFVLAAVPFSSSDPVLIMVNLLAGIIAAMVFYIDIQTLAYVSNGHEYMQRLKEMEVNILLQCVDNETYTGIPELWSHFGITATNTDAINWCEENEGDAKEKEFFTYFMGPSEYMGDNGEYGWYSLHMRYIGEGYDDVRRNYLKAPCPPGNWSIKIFGNEDYMEHEPISITIGAGETAIIHNVTLMKRQ